MPDRGHIFYVLTLVLAIIMIPVDLASYLFYWLKSKL